MNVGKQSRKDEILKTLLEITLADEPIGNINICSQKLFLNLKFICHLYSSQIFGYIAWIINILLLQGESLIHWQDFWQFEGCTNNTWYNGGHRKDFVGLGKP